MALNIPFDLMGFDPGQVIFLSCNWLEFYTTNGNEQVVERSGSHNGRSTTCSLPLVVYYQCAIIVQPRYEEVFFLFVL